MTATTTTPVPSNPKSAQAYSELVGRIREVALLGGTLGLLGWDQETMMPPKGVKFRADQIAQLAKMSHQMGTDKRIGELLAVCEADSEFAKTPTWEPAVNVRELRRGYDRATKLPVELVEELAKVSSMARSEWAQARNDNQFSRFKPLLEKIVELNRRKAECYGWPKGGEPWDALADGYEPGCTVAYVESVFKPLRERLVKLIAELTGSKTKPTNKFNEAKFPIEKQQAFVQTVLKKIGFDFERGRLDTSTHPFCSGTHCNDVRLTTRYHENNVADALGSTMHEAGHGIYEQGLQEAYIGLPMGDAVSLGIHESQSRLWENQVGRSQAFWAWAFAQLKTAFGDAVKGFTQDEVYSSVNIVQPSFIRVEADEATYNLHVMVRFEIERGVMNGSLKVADIPAMWNQKYKEYLGLTVPDDTRGCLQDIHWSMGSIGYFPTYTLGNLYAAQFFEAALAAIPNLYAQFEQGEFGALKKWLNENIHAHGQRYRAAKLCEVVTKKPLSADPLLRHLEGKLRPIYGLWK